MTKKITQRMIWIELYAETKILVWFAADVACKRNTLKSRATRQTTMFGVDILYTQQ